MFALQMFWLRRRGYHAITLDALVAQRKAGAGLPARPVVITFDDGFADCARHAIPILSRHGFTATIFLVAGLMGKTSEWLVPERGLALPLMSWETARRLQRAGFTLGAHSMNHPHLTDLEPHACYEQLHAARTVLEDQLGAPMLHLAYPYGAYNAQVRALAAEAGYMTASSVQIGRSLADDDLLALHRIPVNGNEHFGDFVCRLRTAETLRRTVATYARHWRAGSKVIEMGVTK
jgi:peptidoglycan/xylan/chitin deacetylase (PgdA/CDA1 family)